MRSFTKTAFTTTLAIASMVIFPVIAMADDPYEPNDSRETAWPVTLSIFEIIKLERAYLPSADERDWYMFEGTKDTWVTLTCTPYQGLDVEMTVYRGDILIGAFNNAGKNTAELADMVPIEADGTHYICIGRPESGDQTENETDSYYRLNLEFKTDPYEMNDSQYTSVYTIRNYEYESGDMIMIYDDFVLEGATIFNGHDIDCFGFRAEQGDLITVSCTCEEKFNIAFKVVDYFCDFSKSANRKGMGGEESLVDFVVPESGRYYILVGCAQNPNVAGTGSGEEYTYPSPYTLTLSIKESGTALTSIITGRVRDSGTGEPIKHLGVTAYSEASPGIQYSGATDENGTYTIDVGPQEGTYIVTSLGTSYFRDCVRDISVSPGDTTVADLVLLHKAGHTKNLLMEVYTSTQSTNGEYVGRQIEWVNQYVPDCIALRYYGSENLATASDDEYIDHMSRGACTYTLDRFRFYDEYSYALDDDHLSDLVSKAEERNNWLPSFDIDTSNSYNDEDRTVDLDITLTPLLDLTRNFRINVVVSEDSLNYAQVAYVNAVRMEIYPYYHNDVVREMMTGGLGEPLNDGPLNEGEILTRHYSFPLPDSCIAKNSSIVVFVHEDLDDGIGPVHNAVKVPVNAGAVAVETEQPVPFSVSPPYPNPFNPSTTIEFTLPEASDVTLDIYNSAGQKVRRLVSGRMSVGMHTAVWDGRDSGGGALASGVYFCRLNAGGRRQHIAMTLVK